MITNNNLKLITFIAIGILIPTVKGLQCYVCEDCNEYQDFKELSICGELNTVVTQKPNNIPEVISTTNNTGDGTQSQLPDNNTSPETAAGEASVQTPAAVVPPAAVPAPAPAPVPAPAPAPAPAVKPPEPVDTDDYNYDYNDDPKHNPSIAGGSSNKRPLKVTTTTTTTNPASIEVKTVTSTMKPVVNIVASSSSSSPIPSTASSTSQSSSSTVGNVQPAPSPQDYDYMEYEDPKSLNLESEHSKLSTGSLLKLEEPVCFMYRYYANNTIFTNRGCTTLLNANKFLTCQSFSNGYPMVGCRICDTDGCNKYDLDEVSDDHLNGAGGNPTALAAVLITIFIYMLRNIF
ncbi:uncharacterized protein [Musca autumnalis]|uniref:uncharacterized protein n=1 Tax=Musca autumnalis TaxID=221902 RepID=UPI003CFB9E1E